MRTGISARQGGHQVAQKFMKTTLPFHAAVETGLPSRSFTRNAGIGCGWLANRTTCAWSEGAADFGLVAAAAGAAAVAPTFIVRGWPERPAASPMAKPANPAISANTSINDLFIRRPAPISIMGHADSAGKAGRYLYCTKKREEAERGADSNRTRIPESVRLLE